MQNSCCDAQNFVYNHTRPKKCKPGVYTKSDFLCEMYTYYLIFPQKTAKILCTGRSYGRQNGAGAGAVRVLQPGYGPSNHRRARSVLSRNGFARFDRTTMASEKYRNVKAASL